MGGPRVRVPETRYTDPLNTRVIGNNDPHAHNKLYAGLPGTHLEQRCCDNRPPANQLERTGWYVDANNERVCKISEYWNRPENRQRAKQAHGWWNAECPYREEFAATGPLICGKCFEDYSLWDQFLDNCSQTLDELMPVIQVVTIAISYVPILGTAASFVVNSAVSLAQGRNLDAALLDGIGGALPGQPASRMAFKAVVTVVRTGNIDDAVLSMVTEAVGGNPKTREAIASSLDITKAVVTGEPIDQALVKEIREKLPETGKRCMDLGRRILNGEEITELALDEVTRKAAKLAKSQGADAVNHFLMQAGYQGVIDTLDNPFLAAALRTGLGFGYAGYRRPPDNFDWEEKSKGRNDQLAAKGQELIAANAAYRGRLLNDIRSGAQYLFTRETIDPLSHAKQIRTDVHEINDSWRRGFNIAIGLCEGRREIDQEQRDVRVSLMNPHVVRGFDVGQYIQHRREDGGFRLEDFRAGPTLSDALRANAKRYYIVDEWRARGHVQPGSDTGAGKSHLRPK